MQPGLLVHGLLCSVAAVFTEGCAATGLPAAALKTI
jgi:hypothetical protein